MPTYVYACECGTEFEAFYRIADKSDRTQCPKCDRMAGKILTAPRITTDYPGYTCPITNKWIEGRKAHRENLARHECRVLEPGEHEQRIARQRERDKQFEREIENDVEAALEQMPTKQLEQLGAELQSGVSADIARR